MKFITTTVIGGLLFLVPVVFLVFILSKAFGFMKVVAEPMADFIPIDSVGGVALANLIAFLAVILVCFLAGLVARNALAPSEIPIGVVTAFVGGPFFAVVLWNARRGVTG